MKAIIIVLAISFIAVLSEFTDEQETKFKELVTTCTSKSGINLTESENVKNEQITEDYEKLEYFYICMLRKYGILNDNGDINWEAVRAKIDVQEEPPKQIYAVCSNFTGTGTKEYDMLECLVELIKLLAIGFF